MVRCRWIYCLAALGLLACGGCGGGVGQVSGKLTLNGQPVAAAEVVLENAENRSHTFFGTTLDDGTLFVSYRTKSGMPTGRYQVRVTYFTTKENLALPVGEEGQALRVSGKAESKAVAFESVIGAGKNDISLALENAPPAPPKTAP